MATEQEQELSLFELASAKLSDAQKLMAEARDLLKQDLNNARQEKSAIEEITRTLNEVHFASTIKLNVGGKIYETTLDTLRKDPDSMLCAMFSGRFELKANERDGAYFIDRNGKLFRWVAQRFESSNNALVFIISFSFLMQLLPQGDLGRSLYLSVVVKPVKFVKSMFGSSRNGH